MNASKTPSMTQIRAFLEALGISEEPIGVMYTDERPAEGICPKHGALPSVEDEAAQKVDWPTINANWSCVIGLLWRARKKGGIAYVDREHFGCLGGAFYLGFLKPQLDAIAHYVSTGIPGRLEGEYYFDSPAVSRLFFQTIDPLPAPARYCVFKPVGLFGADQAPLVVIFFARPESVSGLHQLATFVTNDFEAVASPFGAGCSNIVTWPLRYMAMGRLKAVLGGWDPSERKYLKPDELTFAVPYELFVRMVDRWEESFLKTATWGAVRKRVERSRKAWDEA
jgi:uncharacterized protein (DUF169 family)